jgi:protein-L-isoaspartate(D-aspartate) O-methyltransferase
MGGDSVDEAALAAFFRRLDRSVFLGDDIKRYKDEDRPLPIGNGQTISQPTLVAR